MTVREFFEQTARGLIAAQERIGCGMLTISVIDDAEAGPVFGVMIDRDKEHMVVGPNLPQAVVDAAAWSAAAIVGAEAQP